MPISTDAMKQTWNQRAREDLYRYVDARAATDEDLIRHGAADVESILLDVDRFLTPGASVLEIGCGPGRLLGPMAARFREVWGADVSGEMIGRARDRLAALGNVTVLETSGADLAGVPADYFDFCYSAHTFECIPDSDVIRKYIAEAHRVLKLWGIAKVQFQAIYPANPYRTFYDGRRGPADGAVFTMAETVQLVEQADFEILSAYHSHGAGLPLAEARRDVQQYIWIVARKGNGMDEWESVCWAVGQGLRLVPPGARVIVTDPHTLEHAAAAAGGTQWAFLQLHRPANSEAGLAQIEELRRGGTCYLLMTAYSAWWRDHYVEMFRRLERHTRTIARAPEYEVLELAANESAT